MIIGRQNANDIQSSFVIQSMIESAINTETVYSKYLREMVEMYFIPFVNLDGALIGNTVGNLNGLDVKQQWDYSNKNVYSVENREVKEYI